MPGSRVGGYAGKWVGTLMLARMKSALRGISGMPDYEAYIDHVHRCHPDRPVLSEREYYDQYVRARYGDGPTRCC